MRDHRARGERLAAHDAAHEPRAVHGDRHGFPYALVLEGVRRRGASVRILHVGRRVPVQVERHHHHAVFPRREDLEVGIAGQSGEVLNRRIQNEVDFAGKERRRAGRGRGNRRVDHAFDVPLAVRFIPPVVVRREFRADVGFAKREAEGTRAVRVRRGVGLLARHIVLRLERAVLFGPGLVENAKRRELTQEHGRT